MQRYYNFTIRTKLFRAFFQNIFPLKRKRLTDSGKRTAEKNTRRGRRRLPGRGTQVPGGGTYIPWRRTYIPWRGTGGKPPDTGQGDCDKGAEEHGKYIILYIGGNGKGLQQGNFSLIGALRVFQSV